MYNQNVFNKVILQMANGKVIKFTSSIFIEKAAVNDIKKHGFNLSLGIVVYKVESRKFSIC